MATLKQQLSGDSRLLAKADWWSLVFSALSKRPLFVLKRSEFVAVRRECQITPKSCKNYFFYLFKLDMKKLSNMMMKLALMRTAPGKQEQEFPLLQEESSAESAALVIGSPSD